MTMINWQLTIPGNPVPKGRHRTGKGHMFTPKRTREYEKLVGQYAAMKWRREPTEALVFVSLRIYTKDRRRMDCDNIEKSIWDGLQGVVFVDDSQIWESYKRREIDRDNPRVEVWVRDFREIADMDDLRLAAAQSDWLGCGAKSGG